MFVHNISVVNPANSTAGAAERTRGNQRRAAKLLDVKVTTLNCKIKRYGIEVSATE
jgi:DNA-binding protein Fis